MFLTAVGEQNRTVRKATVLQPALRRFLQPGFPSGDVSDVEVACQASHLLNSPRNGQQCGNNLRPRILLIVGVAPFLVCYALAAGVRAIAVVEFAYVFAGVVHASMRDLANELSDALVG